MNIFDFFSPTTMCKMEGKVLGAQWKCADSPGTVYCWEVPRAPLAAARLFYRDHHWHGAIFRPDLYSRSVTIDRYSPRRASSFTGNHGLCHDIGRRHSRDGVGLPYSR